MTHSRSSHLVQLSEADVLRILAETLAAHIEAIFPDQTVPVQANAARVRTLAEFSQMAPVELLVTHVAFSAATRQNEKRERMQGLFRIFPYDSFYLFMDDFSSLYDLCLLLVSG